MLEMQKSNLEQIRELTYELDTMDNILPSVSNLVEMVTLAKDNPVLVTDGETITFLNAQALDLLELFDPETTFLGQPIAEFILRLCPTFGSDVRVHKSKEEEGAFSVLIHRHRIPAFGDQPFYAVIARGVTNSGE